MIEMTATDAKNRFGELIELARKKPVRVRKSGRSAVVVLDAGRYEALVAKAGAVPTDQLVEKLLTRSIERRWSLYEAPSDDLPLDRACDTNP